MVITALLIIVSIAAGGCGPSREQRIRSYEMREVQCIERYNGGSIHSAERALLDYLRLVEEEEASGLPFRRTAWTKALIKTRSALIYRHLGDSGLANQHLRQAVVYARHDAQEEANKAWEDKTDDEVSTLLINAVNKLEETAQPKWRIE